MQGRQEQLKPKLSRLKARCFAAAPQTRLALVLRSKQRLECMETTVKLSRDLLSGVCFQALQFWGGARFEVSVHLLPSLVFPRRLEATLMLVRERCPHLLARSRRHVVAQPSSQRIAPAKQCYPGYLCGTSSFLHSMLVPPAGCLLCMVQTLQIADASCS